MSAKEREDVLADLLADKTAECERLKESLTLVLAGVGQAIDELEGCQVSVEIDLLEEPVV